MFTADEFWHYAIEKYQYEEVKSACLHLQDDLNANVNVLLLSMYLVNRHLPISAELLIYFQKAIQTLDNRIQAHRKKRRALKAGGGECYAKALAQELDLERVIQNELVEAFNKQNCPKGNDSSFSLCINQYLQVSTEAIDFDESDIHAIRTLEANIAK